MLLTSGTSRYNDRQIALWDQVRDVTEQCSKTFATKYHNFTKSFCVFFVAKQKVEKKEKCS